MGKDGVRVRVDWSGGGRGRGRGKGRTEEGGGGGGLCWDEMGVSAQCTRLHTTALRRWKQTKMLGAPCRLGVENISESQKKSWRVQTEPRSHMWLVSGEPPAETAWFNYM